MRLTTIEPKGETEKQIRKQTCMISFHLIIFPGSHSYKRGYASNRLEPLKNLKSTQIIQVLIKSHESYIFYLLYVHVNETGGTKSD